MEAARRLGISLDTLRRWDKEGRIRTRRDKANRRIVPADEVDRLRGPASPHELSARNRLSGTVRDVKVEGLLAQVSVITREAAEELALQPGDPATAVVKATSIMVER